MVELVTATLNGWGASSRRRETRTAELVRDVTSEYVIRSLSLRAMLFHSRSRRVRRFVAREARLTRSLLLVGKSLGARNMVDRVLNQLPQDVLQGYHRTALLTIDPCWPTWPNLRPNLNRETLQLKRELGMVRNVFAVRPQDEQGGAILRGSNVRNVPLTDVDHVSIVQAPEVRRQLEQMAIYLISA